jgi:hypothetical protein
MNVQFSSYVTNYQRGNHSHKAWKFGFFTSLDRLLMGFDHFLWPSKPVDDVPMAANA